MLTAPHSPTHITPEPTTGAGPGQHHKPPKAAMKIANPLLKALVRSPFHGKVSSVLAL